MESILDLDKAKVYYDGIFSNPRLQHPEGVALDNEGYVYCGTENGEIMKIEKDKSKMECLANSGGFILGIAIDENKNVFACEMKEAAVYKYDSSRKTFTEFAKGPKIPNYPVIDSKRNQLVALALISVWNEVAQHISPSLVWSKAKEMVTSHVLKNKINEYNK